MEGLKLFVENRLSSFIKFTVVHQVYPLLPSVLKSHLKISTRVLKLTKSILTVLLVIESLFQILTSLVARNHLPPKLINDVLILIYTCMKITYLLFLVILIHICGDKSWPHS